MYRKKLQAIGKLGPSFLRFLAVGGTATGIDLAIYLLLGRRLPASAAKLISMCCSCVFSFCLNKAWTFRDRRRTDLRQVSLYIAVQAVNISVNVGTNALCLNVLQLHKLLAFVIATGVAMCVNFLLQKVIVFREKK